jgi:hypothetical protein
MVDTIYVCSKCRETSEGWQTLDDWLIGAVPGSKCGEMVIRCPRHITRYAIRKAGGYVEHGKGVVQNWVYEFPR